MSDEPQDIPPPPEMLAPDPFGMLPIGEEEFPEVPALAPRRRAVPPRRPPTMPSPSPSLPPEIDPIREEASPPEDEPPTFADAPVSEDAPTRELPEPIAE